MKKIIIVLMVLFLAIRPSFGQVDNTYKTTLKKMLDLAGTELTFKAAIKQMFTMFKSQYTNVPESVWTDFEKEFMKTSMDEFVDMLAPVYQKYLTVDDLQKVIDFYNTPTGKKYAEKTPLITQESMKVGEEWGTKIGRQFQEKIKQKGY